MSTENDYVRMGKEPDAEAFQKWEQQVDLKIESLIGVGSDFLADWGSYEAFKNGMTVTQAAKAWIAHTKTY